MRWRKASAVLTATLALGGAYWGGCGDDDADGAFFTGNVSSVSGSGGCEAPSGDLLFCVDEHCTRVDDDCDFSRLVFVEGGGPLFVTLRFVDDANEDGSTDFDEDVSVLDEISVCNGDQILVADAEVDFSGTTNASVVKTVDNCGGSSPTRTRTTGTATPTRTGTGTVPTATRTPTGGVTVTPTSTYGMAMNDTPLSSFAFFTSVAVIGLLLPRRRRRNSEDA